MGNNLAGEQVNNNNKAKTKQQTQEQLSSPLSQVLKTYDFGIFENCELHIDISLIYPHLHLLLYHVCRNPHEGPPLPEGICTSGTYCLLLVPSSKEIIHFKGRLIDDVGGFSTIPAAGDGTLTHHLYMSLVSSASISRPISSWC